MAGGPLLSHLLRHPHLQHTQPLAQPQARCRGGGQRQPPSPAAAGLAAQGQGGGERRGGGAGEGQAHAAAAREGEANAPRLRAQALVFKVFVWSSAAMGDMHVFLCCLGVKHRSKPRRAHAPS